MLDCFITMLSLMDVGVSTYSMVPLVLVRRACNACACICRVFCHPAQSTLEALLASPGPERSQALVLCTTMAARRHSPMPLRHIV